MTNRIHQSLGLTKTEKELSRLAKKSFLSLWSFSNVFSSNENGHELCDLIVIFDNSILIFFDRSKTLNWIDDPAFETQWLRWKRDVIDRQVKSVKGAERYLRSGGSIFLDAKRRQRIPIDFDYANCKVHKIIVANGASEACKKSSPENIYGSLAIQYTDYGESDEIPFRVTLGRADPIHVFDDFNLSILLGELDTIQDFTTYLKEKESAISRHNLSYCGEEDLLAHYLLNFKGEIGRHQIGVTDESYSMVMVGEGEWFDFCRSPVYQNTKEENKISYLWDELITHSSSFVFSGELGGDSDPFSRNFALFEMAKEPRFFRRTLSQKILSAITSFPDSSEQNLRQVLLLPSFHPNTCFVFLQIRKPVNFPHDQDYREWRRLALEIACGAAKNKLTNLETIVGICMGAPKFLEEGNSEDFLLMDCKAWSEDRREYYEEANNLFNFFRSSGLRQYEETVTEYVQPKKK